MSKQDDLRVLSILAESGGEYSQTDLGLALGFSSENASTLARKVITRCRAAGWVDVRLDGVRKVCTITQAGSDHLASSPRGQRFHEFTEEADNREKLEDVCQQVADSTGQLTTMVQTRFSKFRAYFGKDAASVLCVTKRGAGWTDATLLSYADIKRDIVVSPDWAKTKVTRQPRKVITE